MVSAGLVFLYIYGNEENGILQFSTVDTYHHIGEGFRQYIQAFTETADARKNDVHIFAVIGSKSKAEQIYKITYDGLKDNFHRILDGQKIQTMLPVLDQMGNTFFESVQEFFCGSASYYPRSYIMDFSDFAFQGIWCSSRPEEHVNTVVEELVTAWAERESPGMYGQQLMLRSFFAQDLIGRKVVACIPQLQTNGWNLVFEGGQQLSLDAENVYLKETASPDDLGAFSVSNVQSILLNPMYAYGTWFYPDGLCEEWHKVFLYACAISNKEWTMDDISEVYERFLSFLGEHVCSTMKVPAILTKEMCYSALLIHIQNFRSYLRGEDEPVLSKDLHQTLNSRYVYLPYLWDLFPHEEEQHVFSAHVFQTCIENARKARSHYKKGVLWEDAAEYMLKHVQGWCITGRRIRTGNQEIDISVVNVSLQDDLWQLGAYILIECKNWDEHVDLHEIRNIAYISNMKGNKTVLLFAANGITRDAEKEINRLANENLYIVHISAEDLLLIENEADCKRTVLQKWYKLKEETDDFSMV